MQVSDESPRVGTVASSAAAMTVLRLVSTAWRGSMRPGSGIFLMLSHRHLLSFLAAHKLLLVLRQRDLLLELLLRVVDEQLTPLQWRHQDVVTS